MDKKGWIIILCILGVIIASYLTYMYYSDQHQACDINSTFECTPVHQSSYALLGGVPVAVLGVIGYLLILAFVFYDMRYASWIAFAGMLFSLRLTYAEFFVIHKLCIFCLVSQVLIIAIWLVSIRWKKVKRYLKKSHP